MSYFVPIKRTRLTERQTSRSANPDASGNRQEVNAGSSTANIRIPLESTARTTAVSQLRLPANSASVEHNVADAEQQRVAQNDDVDKELQRHIEIALAQDVGKPADIAPGNNSDDEYRDDQSAEDSDLSSPRHRTPRVNPTQPATSGKTTKKSSRYVERARLIQRTSIPAWEIYRELDIDAIDLSIFDSPSGKAHLMVDKETAVKRAIVETEGHDDLFRAVLSDIDEFQESKCGDTFAAHGKIRSMQNAVSKAVANYRARKPFEKDLPSKSMLLAARYCESSCTLNATIAGKLAHLNRLDLAQVGTARSNAQPDNSALSSVVVDLQATVNELQRKVNNNLATKADLMTAIQTSSIRGSRQVGAYKPPLATEPRSFAILNSEPCRRIQTPPH
ncbi:hypothetical protein F4781DRAFT_175268 [Annulohypoxylon bovei var. microspora]|nr:hypothetical protein F4781DRAFT_175268 [Annulohypoxylon bovei var. microspora]